MGRPIDLFEKPKVMAKTPNSRVDKLLSSMGYGSRNEIARLAKVGGITLDAAALLDATKRIALTPDLPRRMTIDGEALDPVAGMVILLNKPLGMTCSHKEDGALVYDLLPERWKRRDPAISSIGRLDKQTSGLLLLTDDGDLLHRVISPKHHIKKTYRAHLARLLDGTEGGLFASGELMLNGEDKPLAPAELEVVSQTEALITITEGRYHQVRRMFAATGNKVENLHRERLGGLTLPEGMDFGQWKLLSDAEIGLIFQ
jgi:16S rRNA pseudouridine516 synthase